jgi:8-oxo-dGTP pyrophosphatase MutT (NUDIX family)
VPVNVIRPDARRHWPGWLTTIPCHPFAVRVAHSAVRLSGEHSEFRWARLDEARTLVHWDSDRIALAALETSLHSDPG